MAQVRQPCKESQEPEFRSQEGLARFTPRSTSDVFAVESLQTGNVKYKCSYVENVSECTNSRRLWSSYFSSLLWLSRSLL